MKQGRKTSFDLDKSSQYYYEKFIQLFNDNFEDNMCGRIIEAFDKMLDMISDLYYDAGYEAGRDDVLTEMKPYFNVDGEVENKEEFIEEFFKGN